MSGQIIGLNSGIVDPYGRKVISNHEKMRQIKEAFEKRFGSGQDRTAEQWRDLVRTYTMKVVIEKEKMSESQIKRHMKDK